MTDVDPRSGARRLLLVGHGLLSGLGTSAQGVGLVPAEQYEVELFQLPRPAFTLRPARLDGGSQPTQVAERLAELDELETIFEEVADYQASGYQVIGLAVPGRLVGSRSGRAWLDRVRAIAADLAGLNLEVWTVTAGQASLLEPAHDSVPAAS